MELNEFCEAHALEIVERLHGEGKGMSLVSVNGDQVTSWFPTIIGLEIEVRAHGAAILEAARMTPPGSDLVARYRDNVVEQQEHLKAKAASGAQEARHREELQRLLELADTVPARLFLPLGTIVRLNKDFALPPYWALGDFIAQVNPVAGPLGVVTQNAPGGETSVLVRFPDGQRMANGEIHLPADNHDTHGKYMSVADLEVVGHSSTLDGREWFGPEYATTHRYSDEDGEGSHMNLLVRGFERGPMVLSISDDGDCSVFSEAEFRSDIAPELSEASVASSELGCPVTVPRI